MVTVAATSINSTCNCAETLTIAWTFPGPVSSLYLAFLPVQVVSFFKSSIIKMTRAISFGFFAFALTVTSCLAAISEVKTNNPVTQKPGRFLSLPVAQKCSQRPKEFTYKGRNYFYSGHTQQYKTSKVDWLEARNICREYCMDLVSIETQEENNLIFRLIQQNDAPYIWTSGRLCDFKGCENRSDLEPKNVNGWFWSATRGKIPATNQTAEGWTYRPWSKSGHKKVPQPDNAEFDINGTVESCLSVLNNVYGDGIAWHDIGCYHEKPFVCEDSDELLNYVAATNPGLQL